MVHLEFQLVNADCAYVANSFSEASEEESTDDEEEVGSARRCSKTAHLQTAFYRGNPVVVKPIAAKPVDLKDREILKELNTVGKSNIEEFIIPI